LNNCPLSRQILGADKAYHTREFVETVLVPNTGKPGGWTIDARTTRHEGQAPTLKIREIIETRIALRRIS
jgi:hypothetical protein